MTVVEYLSESGKIFSKKFETVPQPDSKMKNFSEGRNKISIL